MSDDYKVRLADGKIYYLANTTYYDPASMKTLSMCHYVKTIRPTRDEDWKTAMVHHIQPIPAGERLLVTDVFMNFYGRWLKVNYNSHIYYIDPDNVEYAGSEVIEMGD